jgi:hypothetical protein
MTDLYWKIRFAFERRALQVIEATAVTAMKVLGASHNLLTDVSAKSKSLMLVQALWLISDKLHTAHGLCCRLAPRCLNRRESLMHRASQRAGLARYARFLKEIS